jgi:hypothetical protein
VLMATAHLPMMKNIGQMTIMQQLDPPFYEKATNTHLITDKQCAEIVKIISKPAGTKFNNRERGYRRKYQLDGNVAQRSLYRGGAVVTTYKQVFHIIHEGHEKLKHARDVCKNKKCVNYDLGYYGVPEQAVQSFIDTCPMVCHAFNCLL